MLKVKIENFFSEVEDLIKLQLQQNKNQNLTQKFKEGKELIDKLEGYDEEQHGFFRYKYHTEYTSYLKTVGDVNYASIQEGLAKKYEKYVKKPEKIDIYKTKPILFSGATLDNINQGSNSNNPEEESINNVVEEELNKIRNILEDNHVIKFIQITFQQFNEILQNFDDYQEIVLSETKLHRVLDELILNLEDSNNDEDKEQITSSLNILHSLASNMVYLKRVNFIRHVLNSSNKKEILFSNISFTEEEINKRTRKLALYFHPDTNRLQDRHKNLGTELFGLVLEYKESLLDNLKEASINKGNLMFHEKKGNELWKITIDYRNAAKGQWGKLKLLNVEELRGYSSEELERLSEINGESAHREYRAACKIADKAKQLKKQVKLRGSIALCLYVSNHFLEAQLYALSAIHLLFQNSQKVTQEDLHEAKKIFDKVKGKETFKLNTEIKLKDNSDTKLALVKIDQEFSFYEKETLQRSINDDMKNLATELMLKADRSLVRYQASHEGILHAKKRAIKHQIVGGAAIGAGAVVGGAVIIKTAVVIAGGALVGGPIGLVIGLVTLCLGLWGGRSLWKKGTHLLEEPAAREKLNEIMKDSLTAYDKGEYQKFLESLSKEYKTGTSLLKLKERGDVITPEDIIDTLLSHGFRSDGIAYLLDLLGEVLSSGKIKIEGITTNELRELAKNVFYGALKSEKLKAEAEKLDERIHTLRKGNMKEYSDIAKEYKDDAQEMPFQSRLEEMRNIARINLAIFDILQTGSEEIERAIKIIKEIQESINRNYQFVSTTKSRLEALEDFMWIINSKELPEESPKLSLITFTNELKVYNENVEDVDDKFLHYMNEKLRQASSNHEKLHLYNKIAACHEKFAEEGDKINRLNSLCHWQTAQKNYEKAREIDHENLDAALGFAKCLLKLSKYTRVIELSKTSPVLTSSSEYWCFRSIAYCKRINYKKAIGSNIEALKLDHKNKLAEEQRTILQKLNRENKIVNRINRYKYEIYEIDNLKYSSSNESPVYNILSIDGGGIRGVLPALWLSEIEHRTHRPISHLFNMIASTSTSGIIAAGLSAPYETYRYSVSLPKFSASNLLDLYQNKAKDLFTTNSSIFLRGASKYTNKGRLSLFSEHFHEIRLKQALTELVIPATNQTNLTSHLFTRYDAHKDDSKNDTFVDILMATSAAPTYFPPYTINDMDVFLDGGVHLNNPAMAAYYQAIRYKIAKEKVTILSLGTGNYIPEPLRPDRYWSQLFWTRNPVPSVDNIDNQMYTTLGNRYQRWQVWLEEPIRLDDYKSISNLLELGNQYIEELDASDENPINKFVENLNSRSY